MGTRSTITGYWRQRGNANNTNRPPVGPTPAVGIMATVAITFDPTQAAGTATGITLPKGAIPTFAVITNAGATGGIDPTVDVGLTDGNVDGLIAEGDADTASTALLTTGTELGVALTADTEITAGVGASAATGGTVTARVFFYMDDDGVLND